MDTSATIANNTITECGAGSELQAVPATATIAGNTLSSNSTGMRVTNVEASITGNDFMGNSSYGLYNAGTNIVIAENNWWGDASGPLDDSDDTASGGFYNPDGLGDRVTDLVDYDPWSQAPNDCALDSTPPSDIGSTLRAIILGTNITLSWQDLGQDETDYRVYRSASGDFLSIPPGLIGSSGGGDQTTFVDPELPMTIFYYRVRAVDRCGNELASW
jgi:hypothetical protein